MVASALAGTLFILPGTALAQVGTTDTGTTASPGHDRPDVPAVGSSPSNPEGNPSDASADGSGDDAGTIVVTGSRIRRPNLESGAPITTDQRRRVLPDRQGVDRRHPERAAAARHDLQPAAVDALPRAPAA
jgi:hypothetical protein